jgi:hypothetical protein
LITPTIINSVHLYNYYNYYHKVQIALLMDSENKAPLRIRDLMPLGFTRILRDRTTCRDKGAISDLVSIENPGSKYWPAVLRLAEETNPAGYAAWAAANPKKLPAIAA